MSKKSSKRIPPPDYKPATVFPQKPKPERLAGSVWVALGMLIGLVGVLGYYVWSSHHHAPAGSVAAKGGTKTSKPSPTPTTAQTAPGGSAPASPQTPEAPSFDFYKLLPDMKVSEPVAETHDPTHKGPPKPEEITQRAQAGREAALNAPKTPPGVASGVANAPASGAGVATPPLPVGVTKTPPSAAAVGVVNGIPPVGAVLPATVAVKAQPTASAKAQPTASAAYMLQVGAFHSPKEADRLRARLALLGITSTIQTVTATGSTEVLHKVKLGPFPEFKQATEVQKHLQQEGILSILSKEHHG